ncbi:hypothetical protein [Actinomadura fibrosa]|uniref:Uncharacterized protein n=1 Tax=Actinomadura fibrosa TaxID=111802 RepID=A0ABW2XPB5_9ACTN|nr:hypothetical protein [Actinomadura fibrosa]
MNDDLDALLRDHYRAAAGSVHAGPEAVRRFQEAGRAAAPARATVRRWALPLLAAAVTAAVVVAVAVLVWPGGGRAEPPRPLAPPASPSPVDVPTTTPPSPPRTMEPRGVPSPSGASRAPRPRASRQGPETSRPPATAPTSGAPLPASATPSGRVPSPSHTPYPTNR